MSVTSWLETGFHSPFTRSGELRFPGTMAMEAYLYTFLNDVNKEQIDAIAAHLAERGVRRPSDIGFLCRSSGAASAGLVRLGCPQWWSAEHLSILGRAIEVQAANRQGVIALALLELAPPTGGRVVSTGAPPAAAGGKTSLPGAPASGWGKRFHGSAPRSSRR